MLSITPTAIKESLELSVARQPMRLLYLIQSRAVSIVSKQQDALDMLNTLARLSAIISPMGCAMHHKPLAKHLKQVQNSLQAQAIQLVTVHAGKLEMEGAVGNRPDILCRKRWLKFAKLSYKSYHDYLCFFHKVTFSICP